MQRKSVLPVAVGQPDAYAGAKDRRGSKWGTALIIGLLLVVCATVGAVVWFQVFAADESVPPAHLVSL
jgi:hypothetical protein